MASKADIPPGGEGEIFITFKTGNRNGLAAKTIMVNSNDPQNPLVKLSIKAFIEISFGFEYYNLPMGQIDKNASASRTMQFIIRNADRVKLLKLKSSSDFIRAKALNAVKTAEGFLKVPIEITIVPGLPPGQFKETITAYSSDTTITESILSVTGTIMGNVIVTPEQIQFFVYDSIDARNITIQKITIQCKSSDRVFNINDIGESHDRLDLSMRTISPGSLYEITTILKGEYISAYKGNLGGYITLRTNDPLQPEIRINYQIIHHK